MHLATPPLRDVFEAINLAFTMRTNRRPVLRKGLSLQDRLYLYRLVILGAELAKPFCILA